MDARQSFKFKGRIFNMRFKLIKGKQRELIEKYKKEENCTWNEIANKLGVKFHVLWDLKYELNLISEDLFHKLDVGGVYEKYILEIKEEGWGRSNGGINSSGGNTKEIKIPKKNEKLAELIGIILGDGCITSYKRYKVGTYQITIAGDSRKDREYLLNYVRKLAYSCFGVSYSVYYGKNENSMWLKFTGRKMVEFFNKCGIKDGNKISNNQGIPIWIKRNPNLLKPCLRGLVDTDGCIHRMSNKDFNLIRINFTSYCKKLYNDFFYSLISLNYNPHKVKNRIYLSRQNEVKRFIDEIGFSNKKHINRFNSFKIRSPIV